jgi:thiol-disulfide isomerase/thioredoxin
MKLTRTRIILLAIVAFIALFFTFGIRFGGGGPSIGDVDDLTHGQLTDVENSPFYVDYFNSGNLVVLNYWATWCAPCIAEMPALNEVKRLYADSDIAFISYSIDKDSVKLAQFLSSGRFEFTDITLENRAYRNAIMNTLKGKAPDAWIGVHSVPITYIIRNRKVLEKVTGTIGKEELIALIGKHGQDEGS